MKRILTYSLALAVSFFSASSQVALSRTAGQGGTVGADTGGPAWYAGVGGGVPFGVATFSSFGSDGLGAGWSAEVYFGRKFNSVTSAEVSVSVGGASLSARDCCVDRGYWLGSDGTRYNAPVVDMEGWNYADLRSAVSILKLDARVNVNILGLVDRLKGCLWAVEVSPTISVIRTNSNLSIIQSKESTGEGQSGWNLGAGGRLQLRRRLGKGLGVSVYSGATCLAGKKIDGVPTHQHGTNLLIENGLRLSWTFGGGND